MIRISNFRINVKENNDLINILQRKINNKIKKYTIIKKSIDARREKNIFYVYTIDIDCENEQAVLKNKKGKFNVSVPKSNKYNQPTCNKKNIKRPVIVGFGPAGIFAALILSRAGLKPIILERGRKIERRDKDVKELMEKGILDEESNIQFGCGGAGTYSDGKLTTLIKDKYARKEFVLETFCKYGAPKEILYENKPHIGTDNLKKIVTNMKEDIESFGAEIIFNAKFNDIEINKDNRIKSIKYNKGIEIDTDLVVLAIGHSARDTFNMLYNKEVEFRQKTFAIGLRIEHPQNLIDINQYGKYAEILPHAEYKMVSHPKDKRSMYTFCMCPGGYVVCASSEKDGIVTNGMSNYKRNSKNANSALLVNVGSTDFKSSHPLAGIEFQRELEIKAFELGGGNYIAPYQKVGDFMGMEYKREEYILPSYRPGVKEADIKSILPKYITESIIEGIRYFDNKIKGFANPNAILTGIETRSSSPVRIVRDEKGESNINGIYPCGEGSGYAGGIMSSAVDGIKTAEKIIKRVN